MDDAPAPLVEGSEAWGAFLKAAVKDAHGWMPSVIGSAGSRLRDLGALAAPAWPTSPMQVAIATLESDSTQWARRIVSQLVKTMLDEISAGSGGLTRSGQPSPVPARALSIVSDEVVDEEIAMARSTQAAESEAETVLIELAALCSSLKGLPRVSPDAYPLRPGLVARAVRAAVAELQQPAGVRLALVQALTQAVARELPAMYRRHLDWLTRSGVRSTRYAVKQPPARYRNEALEATRASPGVATWRPRPGHGGIDSILGDAAKRFDIPADALPLLRRLQGPLERVMQSTSSDPAPQHPAWQLLDRLLAAASVHGELCDPRRPGDQALEAMLTAIESAGPADAMPFQAAIEAVDFRTSSLLDEQSHWVERESTEIRDAMALDSLRAKLRAQIGERLEHAAAPSAVRQFLLGPWTVAMAHSATAMGMESAQFHAQKALVDELLAHFEPSERSPRQLDIARRLLTHARLGLSEAGWTSAAVTSELGRLKLALLEWTGRLEVAAVPAAGPGGTPPHADAVDTRSSRPVPSDSGAPERVVEVPTVAAEEADEADPWVETLPQGAYCRMFLLGRWMTTRLVWTNAGRTMFVFTSRHAGRVHAISRQSLRKLRDSGLADVIQPGQFVETAIKDLVTPAWVDGTIVDPPGAEVRGNRSQTETRRL